tara:strand:- start:3291 stop:3839 length:549 start_codon:yes stop_codon:yes gene_type:complete
MSGTARRSATLTDALAALSGVAPIDQATATWIQSSSLVGRPTRDIIDSIVAYASPLDGSQDAEASQRAMTEALADLLTEQPQTDLFNLTEEAIDWILGRFIGNDIIYRLELDLGDRIHKRAKSFSQGVRRMDEMKDYVRQVVAVEFQRTPPSSRPSVSREATSTFSRKLIESVYAVFESYIR